LGKSTRKERSQRPEAVLLGGKKLSKFARSKKGGGEGRSLPELTPTLDRGKEGNVYKIKGRKREFQRKEDKQSSPGAIVANVSANLTQDDRKGTRKIERERRSRGRKKLGASRKVSCCAQGERWARG